MTAPSDRPSKEHIQIEQHLIDAEVELAKSLQELSAVEAQLGMRTDSDHRLEQAAEQEDQARHMADKLRDELTEELKRRNSEGPKR